MIESLLSLPAANMFTSAGLVLGVIAFVGILASLVWEHMQRRGRK